MSYSKQAFIFLTPLFATLFYFILPADLLDPTQRIVSVVVLWMVLWWITEAIPLSMTSLLPITLFPILGIMSLKQTAVNYAHPVIFLLIGGFIIAVAMEKTDLHKRCALNLLNLLSK